MKKPLISKKILDLLQSCEDANIELAIMLARANKEYKVLYELSNWYYTGNAYAAKYSSAQRIKRLFCDEWFIATNPLYEVPESFALLSHLQFIELNYQELETFPKMICDFPLLEELNLEGNKISGIPEEIGNLENLTKLNLFDNNIREIPFTIGKLKNLEYLELSENPLEEIPMSIGELKQLKELGLEATHISKQQRAGLKYLLPDCVIK